SPVFFSASQVVPRLLSQLFIARSDTVEVLLGQFFEIQKGVMGVSVGPNQLIKLEMHGFAVPVLGVLDQEDHQEGDDCRARIDDQLPGVTEMEGGAGETPDQDDQASYREGEGLTGFTGRR